MNKKTIIILIILFITIVIAYCIKIKIINKNENNNSNEVISTMKILIDNKEYNITFEDNETTKSLINLLPLEFDMNELNGNEKYIYLDNTLPTNSYNPKYINAGDIMLYGNNCLVIFYKSFDTSYSYTKIGHIDNLDELGNGNIKIKISLK
jgi:hypothetical protein